MEKYQSEMMLLSNKLRESGVVGGKIIDLQVLADDGDGDRIAFIVRPKIKKDVVIYLQSDPEGNGPGWLDVVPYEESTGSKE